MIMAGDVFVAGQRCDKAGTMVALDADVDVRGQMRFVSRGGLKLEAALEAFDYDCSGRVVIDVGASTGGFTDCVLQRGAARVYAVDVGYGQLAWKLRADERVVVIERTNARGHHTFTGKLDRDSLGFGERMITKMDHAPEGDFRRAGKIDQQIGRPRLFDQPVQRLEPGQTEFLDHHVEGDRRVDQAGLDPGAELLGGGALLAGDVINGMGYRLRPFEVEPGATDRAIEQTKRDVYDALATRKSVLAALFRGKWTLALSAIAFVGGAILGLIIALMRTSESACTPSPLAKV